ncbi:MAG: DUF3307 domain-containing protein [Sulfitobacter sp.]
MPDVLQNALIFLILLQIKHLFADFYLQTPRMLAGRDQYVHVGRLQHAIVHVAGSVIAFVVMGVALPVMLLIVVAEGVAHYHIDWAKGYYSQIKQQTPSDAGYWRALGFDQAMHQLTYIAMIWAWAYYGQS